MPTRPIVFFAVAVLLTSCKHSSSHYYDRANQLFSGGQYADAAINYRKAIQANASYGDAYAGLGLAELKLGHGPDAYRALSRAVELLPAREDIKVALADLILAAYLGDKQRPQRLYVQLTSLSDQLIAKDPKSYDGLRLKAYLAASDNHPEQALELFANANAARPGQPQMILAWTQVLFQTNQFEKGEKLALDLIRREKSYGPIYDLLYLRYLSTKRLDEAEKLLQMKVNNNPKDAAPVMQLASHYARAGRRAEMTATLQRLLGNPHDFPQAHLQAGDLYSRLQDWDEAIRQYEAGAKANPAERPIYLKKIANVWLSQGKGEQAAAVVDQLAKDQPSDEQVRAVRASLLLNTPAPEKVAIALAEFQDLVKKNPDNAVWHFNLGRAYAAKGNSDAAWTQFQEAIKRRKDYVQPRLALAEISQTKSDYKEALRHAGEALDLSPNLPAARLLRSAGLIGTANYAQARLELERLEKDYPQYREAQLELGSLDLTQKKFKQAEERFRKLYEQGQQDPRALAGLVETYYAQDDLEKAFRLLTEESRKSPGFDTAYSLLADVAVRLSRYEVALDAYRHLLTQNPESADLRLQMGSVYRLKGDIPEATASFETAVRLAPSDPYALTALAQTQALSGRQKDAVASYRRVLQIKPEYAPAMNNLAFLIAQTGGNLDEALNLAQQAIKKSPQQPNFADTLGWIYLKKGMTDAALQVFRTVAQKNPESASFHYHLGLALLRGGDKTKAKTELQIALSKKPSPEVYQSINEALVTVASGSAR
jgi:tetratricopeptide (TPR) repeat protein